MDESKKWKYVDFEVLQDNCVDIDNRKIYLVGDIISDVVEPIVQQINYLSSPTHCKNRYTDPISIVINSCGGHDDMMLYLYDTITMCNCEIHTIGMGMVCSAAALILVAGDKRFATPNCWFMTHKGRAVLEGDDDEIQAQAELNRKIAERYWKLIARHTERTAQWWYNKSKGEGEAWLNTDDMVKYGVIDSVVDPIRRALPPLSNRKLKTRVVEDDDDLDLDDC